MSSTAPHLEFVDDSVEITTTTTLRQAERNLGMSVEIGKKLGRFVLRIREQFAPEAPLGLKTSQCS